MGNLTRLKRTLKQYRFTILYILFVITLNCIFIYMPNIGFGRVEFNMGDIVVGIIYLLRDLTQREIKQKVLFATLFGACASYLLADKTVAIASVLAFSVGETLDWLIYTLTKRPLSQRLLWSSLISVPIDSLVFLICVHHFNLVDFSIMTMAKIIGVMALWFSWRIRNPITRPIAYAN